MTAMPLNDFEEPDGLDFANDPDARADARELARDRWIVQEADRMLRRAQRQPIQIHMLADVLTMEQEPELVQGVLPAVGIGSATGPSMQYKSFVVLDLALCVTSNRSWFRHCIGKPRRKKSVLLALGEGQYDAGARAEAAIEAHGYDGAGLHYLLRPGDLTDTEWLAELMKAAEDVNPDLIIFDSGTDFFGPIDDNSSKDAQVVITAMKRLSEKFQCFVLVVAHTGHENRERQRGSARWRQAWDAEMVVIDGTISCAKYKYGRPWESIPFEMRPVKDSIAVFPSDEPNLPPAWDVLIKSGEPVTAGQVAEKLGISKQKTQEQLNRLRELGRATTQGAGKRGDPLLWEARVE